ncbi:hypothetical protein EVAR_9270_1 [Eumeta japonica]|uniref:Uncharacterized protein n=1 Tax=Eumeta variegata TaxID=151549 RepID=A0A4C1TNS7_EUMVA|nr:hypothetical protein EVAR_9270_1 [Eumeta japonica]
MEPQSRSGAKPRSGLDGNEIKDEERKRGVMLNSAGRAAALLRMQIIVLLIRANNLSGSHISERLIPHGSPEGRYINPNLFSSVTFHNLLTFEMRGLLRRG